MFEQPRIDPEFKDLIPPLAEDEYRQLEQNILTHRKCHDAILLWEGVIVDGFNRFCICVTHGIEFKIEEMSFPSREDAKVWIIENQLGRRNLCDAARIELAMCKAELLRGKARQNQSLAGGDKKSLFTKSPNPYLDENVNVEKSIAKEAGVGQGTFQRYRQLKTSGRPDLLEKVRKDEIKIGTAHRMLESDPIREVGKHLRQADKLYNYISQRLPFEDTTANSRVHEILEQITHQLHTMINRLEGGQYA